MAIGPCISNKNYEVQKDFKRKFYNQSKENLAFFKLKKNKIYFSLNKYIFNQISNYGIKNIDIIHKDTFNKKNLLKLLFSLTWLIFNSSLSRTSILWKSLKPGVFGEEIFIVI